MKGSTIRFKYCFIIGNASLGKYCVMIFWKIWLFRKYCRIILRKTLHAYCQREESKRREGTKSLTEGKSECRRRQKEGTEGPG